MKKEDIESRLVAPSDKVIIRIEKGDDRLSWDITTVKNGLIIAAGDKVSGGVQNVVGIGEAFFGGATAELPYEAEGCGYLVMTEENLYSIVKA